jgi:ATP-dependent Lon protease
MLVFSYNDARRVHPVLLDRLRRIRMAAPTADEKRSICTSHLIPRAVGRYAGSDPIDVDDEVISLLLRRNDKTCGMRGIEQDIDLLVSSARLIKTCADGSILGIEAGSTARLDLALAEGLLAATDRACDATAAPPLGMYT